MTVRNKLEFFQRVAAHIRKKGLFDTLGAAWNIGLGLADYHCNRHSLKTSKLTPCNWAQIRTEMEQNRLPVISYRVDIPAFREWLHQADFPEYYVRGYGSVFIEKALEHYVGADLLGLKPEDVLVDVAAASSPWLYIAQRIYKVKSLALDLKPPTIPLPGHKLAADATMMPFRNESIDSLVLHCAYETFEGDADSQLIPEASRVLRKGGKLLILPLYMHHIYYVDSSPGADRRGVDYQDAKRVWRENSNGKVGLGGTRFSRKYSIAALTERVVKYKGSMHLAIYYIENEKEVDQKCYLKFAALFEKT